MLYYIILFILIILSSLDIYFFSKKRKVYIYVIGIILFILLGGLRWNTGNDWVPYHYYFSHDAVSKIFIQAFEPGYIFFVKFIRSYTNSYTIFLLIFSFFIVSLKSIVFYRYTNAILMVLVLYWASYLGDITAIRQSLAVSICLFSIYFIEKRKLIYHLLCVYIAMQIHFSAFIFLLAYPVYHAHWSNKFKVSLLLFCIVIGAFNPGTFIIQSIIPKLLPGSLSMIAIKANDYADAQDAVYTSSMSKGSMLAIGILKRSLLLPVMMIEQKKIKKFNYNYEPLLNLFIIGNCVYFLVNDIFVLQRMAVYFYPLEIILMCMILEYNVVKWPFYFIFSLYSILKLTLFLKSSWDLHVPYIWIFSDDVYRKMY